MRDDACALAEFRSLARRSSWLRLMRRLSFSTGRPIRACSVSLTTKVGLPFFPFPPPLFSFFSEINTNVHLLGGGLLLNAKGRVSLMKRLQRDEEKPPAPKAPPPAPTPAPVVPMPCLFLSNMFDPAEETNPNFHVEIQEDVQGECGRFGQVLHLFVDPNSKVFESSIRFDS